MTRQLASPIHAVPLGEAVPRDHSASSMCWCRPRQALRDLATLAVIYIHANVAPVVDDMTTTDDIAKGRRR